MIPDAEAGSARSATYRPDIDGLRAVAVAAVIASHLDRTLLPAGFLGVDVFFVISGFVITAALMRHPHRHLRDFVLDFYGRRVRRLLPALALCVVATCLIGFLFIPAEAPEFTGSWQAGLAALFGTSNIYLAWGSAEYQALSTNLNLFTQTWSLGVEEQFYLLFPWLLWFAALRRPGSTRTLLAILLLVIAASFAGFALMWDRDQPFAYFSMPTRIWEIALGAVLFLVHGRLRLRPRVREGLALAALAALVAVLFMPLGHPVLHTAAAVLSAALLIGASAEGTVAYRLLGSAPLVRVGLISYSLYLWHWSVIAISRWTVGIDAWTMPFQLALIVLLAVASYRYVEEPLRRARWSAGRPGTIGRGLALSGAAAVVVIALGLPLAGLLFTGDRPALAHPNVETLTRPNTFNGALAWRGEPCVLSSNDQVGKRIDPADCTFRTQDGPPTRFLVIGNSYSATEIEMYKAIPEAGLGSVTVTSAWGASPTPELPNQTAWRETNRYYWDVVVPALVGQLNPGDVVLMINDIGGFAPANPPANYKRRLRNLTGSLQRFVDGLGSRGIGVVFQSVNPFVRDAKCSLFTAIPQWFRPEPRCPFLTRKATIERKKALDARLRQVAAKTPNLEILDVFDVLCPEAVCGVVAGGMALYRDEFSHMSDEASVKARPRLVEAVQRLQRKMAAAATPAPDGQAAAR